MKTSMLKGLMTATAIGALAAGFAGAAQAQSKISTYEAALTPSGIPNLEGVWSHATMTRFERPEEYAGRVAMTPAEVAKLEGAAARSSEAGRAPTDPNATVDDLSGADCHPSRGTACNYNDAWVEPGDHVMRVNGEPRTSIVTSPATGRIPYKQRPARKPTISDNPENRSLPERCLGNFNTREGVVINTSLYNNNIQLVQGKDTVAVIVEMNHDARLVRLNDKHPEHGVSDWFGDSVGHYDGDTLVVETANIHPLQRNGATAKLKVTERFTRTGKDRLLYRFTVEDPDTYTQPWGGEYELITSNGPLYEYACHEGNRGLEGILAGARQEEKTPQAAADATPAAQ